MKMIAILIYLILQSLGVSSFADDCIPQGTATTLPTSCFDALCKTVLEKNDKNTSDIAGQELPDCQAADSSIKSTQADEILVPMWSTVAGVCGLECLLSFGVTIPGMASMVCDAMNLAAGITDVALTASLSNNLAMTLAQDLLPALVFFGMDMASYRSSSNKGTPENSPDSKDSKNPENPESSGNSQSPESSSLTQDNNKAPSQETTKKSLIKAPNLTACISTAIAAFTASSHSNGAKQSQNSAENSLYSVYQLQSQNPASSGGIHGTTNSGNLGSNSQGGGGGGNLSKESPSAPPPTTSSNAGNSFASAATAGGLPAQFNSPEFAAQVQKNTGSSLGDFLKSATNPVQTMSRAAGTQAMNANQASAISQAFQHLDDQIQTKLQSRGDTNSTYSTGSAKTHESSNPEPDMNSLMSHLMDQFGPKDKATETSNPSTNTFVFGSSSPLQSPKIAENREVSLFERMSYHYHLLERGFKP